MRLNADDSDAREDDVSLLASLPALTAAMVPKAESSVRLDDLSSRLGVCIHPRQVAPIHRAFAPTEAELAWARRVVAADAASGGAAVQLDGRMVDLPVVTQARRTLSRAAEGQAVTA